MYFHRRPRRNSDVNIVPLIDIFTQLLFFFMIVTTFKTGSSQIPINLPKAQQAAAQTRAQFVVTIDDQGFMYVDGSRVDAEQLRLATAAALEAQPSLFVVIRADKGVKYEAVIGAIDAVRSAGVSSLGLAVERTSSTTPPGSV
ncbi:MAG: biopolymer transporter ExbD [Limnochordales bacterium]|nr:biopolymer transporter ExbD [Limnochordales bacterium]